MSLHYIPFPHVLFETPTQFKSTFYRHLLTLTSLPYDWLSSAWQSLSMRWKSEQVMSNNFCILPNRPSCFWLLQRTYRDAMLWSIQLIYLMDIFTYSNNNKMHITKRTRWVWWCIKSPEISPSGHTAAVNNFFDKRTQFIFSGADVMFGTVTCYQDCVQKCENCNYIFYSTNPLTNSLLASWSCTVTDSQQND